MKQRISCHLLRLLYAISPAALLLVPYVADAQTYYGNKDSVQGYMVLILSFINYDILPLIFGIALLFFIWNAARYFILDTENDSEREKAKTFALYGIAAFVILVSIWGIVNMLVNGIGINNNRSICPDYLQDWCASNNYNNSSNGFQLNIQGSFTL